VNVTRGGRFKVSILDAHARLLIRKYRYPIVRPVNDRTKVTDV